VRMAVLYLLLGGSTETTTGHASGHTPDPSPETDA